MADTSKDPTEEEDNARIVATLLLNTNYDRNDYFDEDDESTVGPDDDYDNTNAHVMVRATRNSNAIWKDVGSPTAISMNRDDSSGNNPVTPIDGEIDLEDESYEDIDASDGMIETVGDSGTS